MLNSVTKKKIDNARDILVGKIPMPTTQVEQITLALIYKFMGDMDKRAKALGDTSGFFANGYEQYAWDRLMDKSLSARERVKLYGEGLEKMSVNPHIPQLFRDIFRNAFLPFNDPETLKLFLDQIDQFSYDHSEELGNAFEYLLSVLGSQGDAGQFRTPRHIIDFIVEVVEPTIDDRILDPACGTAGFLISAFKYLQKQGLPAAELKKVTDHVVGYDISHDMVRLSLVNLYLHQFPNPHVYEYDSLTSEDRWDDSFDCILANPPFMTPKGGIRPHSRFAIPSNRAEVLFVDYIMEHLSINGKAGIIVPEGVLFKNDAACKSLRKMMVEENFLWAVVSMPAGIFQPYSGVKTSVLFFDRSIAERSDSVLFVKVENDGFDLGVQRKKIDQNDLPDVLKSLQNCKRSGLVSEKLTNIVSKQEIASSGSYTLLGEKFQTNTNLSKSKWRMVELGEILDYEQPTKYIVNSTEYSDTYKTPVLTAGKTFILGYTNETEGVFEERLPVIIFDDFTTATKLVDFKFKVKSSAMKILHTKKDVADIKYVFLAMQKIKFNFSEHKRFWISEYSKIKIPLPPLNEQKLIVQKIDEIQLKNTGLKQQIDSNLLKIDEEISELWGHTDNEN